MQQHSGTNVAYTRIFTPGGSALQPYCLSMTRMDVPQVN